MKSSKKIVAHLKNSPSLVHLKKVEAYRKLLALLPSRLGQGVRFMYNKHTTLFFVLEHPGLKMEFNYKTDLIKKLLKQLIIVDPSCSIIDAEDIKTFITNKPPLRAPKNNMSTLFYNEKSLGVFENRSQSPELYNLFESIREKILCLQKH